MSRLYNDQGYFPITLLAVLGITFGLAMLVVWAIL